MTRIAVLVAAVAAVWPAFAQESPAPAGLALTLTLDRAKAQVGDDVQYEARLENTTDKDVEVTELTLEERSLSLAVSASFTGGGDRKKDYTISRIVPDAQVMARLPLGKVVLGPKKSLNYAIRLPAIAVGKYQVTAKYANGGEGAAISSSAASLEVEASTSGGKLAVVVEVKDLPAFTIWLAPDQSPANVTHFANLVKRGFYNDSQIHRIVKKSWFQGGCPYGLGIGGPGYSVRAELDPAREFNRLDVALSGFEKTGFTGSQFFVCLSNLQSLKGKYTVVGSVESKDEKTIDQIGGKNTDKNTDQPTPQVSIRSMTLVVK